MCGKSIKYKTCLVCKLKRKHRSTAERNHLSGEESRTHQQNVIMMWKTKPSGFTSCLVTTTRTINACRILFSFCRALLGPVIVTQGSKIRFTLLFRSGTPGSTIVSSQTAKESYCFNLFRIVSTALAIKCHEKYINNMSLL